MSTWTVGCQDNDEGLREQILAIAAALRANPNVEIVP